jgi:hypothetical protein
MLSYHAKLTELVSEMRRSWPGERSAQLERGDQLKQGHFVKRA